MMIVLLMIVLTVSGGLTLGAIAYSSYELSRIDAGLTLVQTAHMLPV